MTVTFTIDGRRTRIPQTHSPVPLLRSSDVSHAEREVAAGRLVRVRRGILAPATAWAALRPWERYASRVHAVGMTHPSAVFCLESAAVLLGLPLVGDPTDVHVLDAPASTSRSSGGIRTHTTAGDRRIVMAGGMLATSALDTAIDLARARHRATGLAIADAALRADLDLTVEMMVAENEARSHMRGRRHARWALHRATPLAETALESISRAAIEWLGFEQPELQVTFRADGATDRVDMWWGHASVVGEADGDVKYDGSLQDPARAIREEKARDRRLRRHATGIAHWGWSDVAQIAPLRQSLEHAGLRRFTAESSADLHSLRLLLHGRRSGTTGRENAPGRRD